MTFDRIRSPENHQIGPILDFAQSTSGFADFLQCHDRWRMAERSRGIERGADMLAEGDGRPLPLRAAARQTVDQGRMRGSEEFCCAGHGRFERDSLAIDHGNGGLATLLTERPRFGQTASPLAFANPLVLYADAQIVANAAANRAGDIVV